MYIAFCLHHSHLQSRRNNLRHALASSAMDFDALTQSKRCAVDGCSGWSFVGVMCKQHRLEAAEADAALKLRAPSPHAYSTQCGPPPDCLCADVPLAAVEVIAVSPPSFPVTRTCSCLISRKRSLQTSP